MSGAHSQSLSPFFLLAPPVTVTTAVIAPPTGTQGWFVGWSIVVVVVAVVIAQALYYFIPVVINGLSRHTRRRSIGHPRGILDFSEKYKLN